jgi:hypothetical protein
MPLRAVSRGQSPGRVEKALRVRHLRRTATLRRSGLPYVVRHGKKPPRRAPARFPAHHPEGESRATRLHGAGRRRSLRLVRRRDRRPACMALPCVLPDAEPLPRRGRHTRRERLRGHATPKRLVRPVVQWASRAQRPPLRRPVLLAADREHRSPARGESVRRAQSQTRRPLRSPRGMALEQLSRTLGIDPAPSFLAVDDLLAHFGPTCASARKTFALFVADALAAPRSRAA